MLNVPVAVRRRPRSDFSPNDRRDGDLVGSVKACSIEIIEEISTASAIEYALFTCHFNNLFGFW
jgi:hypothetical protein